MTCRFSRGTMRPPGRRRACQRARAPALPAHEGAEPAEEPERAERSERFIAVHASGRPVPCLSQLCDKSAHEVERGDRRAPAAPSRGRRARTKSTARSPPGPQRAGSTSPTGFSARAAAGAGDARHGHGRRRRRAARARPPPSPPRSRPTRRRARAAPPAARRAPLLDLVRVRDDAAQEDVARPGHGRQPRRDQPARARLRRRERPARARGRARARSPRSALPRARTRTARAAPRARPRASSAARLRARLDERSTWISKSRAQIVASTPSPSPPAAASACATADSDTP